MKAPDGFIYTFKDKGGTKIEVEQKELIMCRSCKHCRKTDAWGRIEMWCDYHHGDFDTWESLENDEGFCSWAERRGT